MEYMEKKLLNAVAYDLFGCDYDSLDYEEQDAVYCYLEDTGEM